MSVSQDVFCLRMPRGTRDIRLAKRQQFGAALPRLWLNIAQTVIHPSQLGSDLFHRSGQMNFTLKVTEKLFQAAENPLLISVFTRELVQCTAEGGLPSLWDMGTQGKAHF